MDPTSLAIQFLTRLEEMTHPDIGDLMADRATLDRGWRLLRRLIEQPEIARGAAERFLVQNKRAPAPPLHHQTLDLQEPAVGLEVEVETATESMDDFFDSISARPVKVVRTDGTSTSYPWEKES
jgi:hypothetical protein